MALEQLIFIWKGRHLVLALIASKRSLINIGISIITLGIHHVVLFI